MSFDAMAWASKQKTGSAGAKLVLLILADHANGHTGQCTPKIKRIADVCEMSESTVKTHIKHLESLGLVGVKRRFVEGVQISHQYMLNLEGVGQNLTGVGQNLTHRGSESGYQEQGSEPVIEPLSSDLAAKPPSASAKKTCPHDEIIAAYHEVLTELPKVKVWTDSRKRTMQSQWDSRRKAGSYATEEDGIEYWRSFFQFVKKSDFLCGRSNADRSFKADLEWLIKPANFVKVIERKYHGE